MGVERVKEIIDREVFSDTSVSQTETWDRLQELVEHLRELQETLDESDQEQEPR